MKTSDLFVFLGGALVGATAALLFAPAKGSETREKIKDSLEDGYETVKREFKKRMPDNVEETETANS